MDSLVSLSNFAESLVLKVNETGTKLMIAFTHQRHRNIGQNFTIGDHNFEFLTDIVYLELLPNFPNTDCWSMLSLQNFNRPNGLESLRLQVNETETKLMIASHGPEPYQWCTNFEFLTDSVFLEPLTSWVMTKKAWPTRIDATSETKKWYWQNLFYILCIAVLNMRL